MKKSYVISLIVGLITGIAQNFYVSYTTIYPSCNDCEGAYLKPIRGFPLKDHTGDELLPVFINFLIWVIACLALGFIFNTAIKKFKK